MKQPKKLTRDQKVILTKKGLNSKDYMLLSEDNDTFTVISKDKNEYGYHEQCTFEK